MTKSRLAEQFKRIVADATSSAAFKEHLASDFIYAYWGARPCLSTWRPFGLCEDPNGTHTPAIWPSLNVELKEIYVDAERSVVIACVGILPMANHHQNDEMSNGVWIAHFDKGGFLSRLDDYSDIRYFDASLPDSDTQ